MALVIRRLSCSVGSLAFCLLGELGNRKGIVHLFWCLVVVQVNGQ